MPPGLQPSRIKEHTTSSRANFQDRVSGAENRAEKRGRCAYSVASSRATAAAPALGGAAAERALALATNTENRYGPLYCDGQRDREKLSQPGPHRHRRRSRREYPNPRASPSPTSLSTTWLPMKPAPPVTKTLFTRFASSPQLASIAYPITEIHLQASARR